MNGPYVSDFPGTEQVSSAAVFAKPGYHEQKQSIEPSIIVLFVTVIISFLLPPVTTIISLVTGPIGLGILQARRVRNERLPGILMLRAAVGLSVLSVMFGTAVGLWWFLSNTLH